jgi:F-type H+-transporting ATPase subunit b
VLQHSTDNAPVLPLEEAAEQAVAHGGSHAAPTNEASEAAEHGTGGLPQFAFEHWGGQIAYLLILFAILYLLVSKVFAPRLRRVLDERRDTIAGAVSAARQVQAEADAQAAAAKAEVERARAEARALAAAAKTKAASEAQARKAEEEAEVSARIAEAEAGIGRTRDAAMANVSTIAADTAAAMVERLTGRAATAAELNGAR